jgi:hypothetical protein
VNELRKLIESDYKVEGRLRSETARNIKRLMDKDATAACGTAGPARARASAPRRTPAPAKASVRRRRQDEVRQGEYESGHRQEAQGKEDSFRRERVHPGFLQQHHHHHHRPAGEHPFLGPPPAAWGFRGAKKSTPFAAQTVAETAVQKAQAMALREVNVFVKGPGVGRESAIRS